MVLDRLLRASPNPPPIADLDAWWSRHREAGAGLALPVDRAIAGGFAADRLAYAFAGGYCEALAALVPETAGHVVALCATEQGGNHPRAIETAFDGARVTGRKQWTTLGGHADAFLVLAREGERPDGRPALALVRVDARAEGIAVHAMPPTPFVPEIPHARVELLAAPGARLPGDGWADYVKPFRTVEDLHVHAALLGYLLQLARRCRWPEHHAERIAVAVCAARDLAHADPRRPVTHLALAGVLAATRDTIAAADWAAVEPDVRARWDRDRPLLDVASKARARRRELAWAAVADAVQ